MTNGTYSPLARRRENFPVGTLRYAEKKVSHIRREVMAMAARIAAEDSTNSSVYRVEFRHVDEAVNRLLREPPVSDPMGT